MTSNHKKIQEVMDNLVNEAESENWWITSRFIQNTLPKIPSEIKVIELPPVNDQDNFNCFIFALGLHVDPDLIKKSKGKIFSSFFKKLIEIKALHKVEEPQYGDIIAYKNIDLYKDDITHTGLVINTEYVISKWAWGPTLLHNKSHIPLDWGNDIEYYSIAEGTNLSELFDQYKAFNKITID